MYEWGRLSVSADPPQHLSPSAVGAWREVVAGREQAGFAPLEAPIVEMIAVQLARMRDAAARVDGEGLLIADPKGNPVPHPALEVERAAGEQLRRLLGEMATTAKRSAPIAGPKPVELEAIR